MNIETKHSEATLTPMMRQYLTIKEGVPDSILMFRLGDFYEMFFDDAKKASSILNIALTARGNKVPMCGVPHHAAEAYIAKLIKEGIKVAVCDQIEDAAHAKGIVKRGVTRIVSPGTVLDDTLLNDKSNNYLSSIYKKGDTYGLSYVDLSTGEFKATHVSDERDLLSELVRIRSSEIILPQTLSQDKELLKILQNTTDPYINYLEDWVYDYETSVEQLKNQFKVVSLDGYGLKDRHLETMAAAAIIRYLKDNLYNSLAHLKNISLYEKHHYMILDSISQKNLELINTLRDGKKEGTLLGILDKTVTPMAGRMLKQWIVSPLIVKKDIDSRHNAIEAFIENKTTLYSLREILHEIKDLERIIARLNCGSGNPRDMLSLKASCYAFPRIKQTISAMSDPLIVLLAKSIDEMEELATLLESAIREDAPIMIREGNIIKEGYSEELDQIRSIYTTGRGWIAELQKQEIERTGIKSLKVRYNKVFGYYIEISNINLSSVPDNYVRKQTLVNGERFITDELKEYESKVLGAQEKAYAMEITIFNEIKNSIVCETKRIQEISQAIATLDTLASFSLISISNDYVKPTINNSDEISVQGGRHPVIEHLVGKNQYVPNDVELNTSDNQLLIITGPNMAGKSTYIRQVALIVLMAQIGCYVPAESAKIGIVDRIFTRVGASDDIASGQSTFMVEMTETANIINNTTQKSLIILDEIGRGTSTFDGLAIAWSVCEYLHNNKEKRARTLFATHYHELTELELSMSGVKNYNVAVREWEEDVIFLRKIIRGGTDKSYGIHVAKLAGLPKEIISRAFEILSNLEDESISDSGKPALARKRSDRDIHEEEQLQLFPSKQSEYLEYLSGIDTNAITPLEALQILVEMKKKYKNQ